MDVAETPTQNEILAARQSVYRFLAECYCYPGPEFDRGVTQPALWECLTAAGSVLGEPVERGVARLHAGVVDQAPGLIELQVEFTYLFVNAMDHLPAPPYESAYRGDGLLMGEAVSQVLEAYRNAGLAILDTPDLLPDHVTAEMEFMAYLIEREAVARREAPARVSVWQELQERFLVEHLLRWGPALVERVIGHARHTFYTQVGDLTAALFRIEKQSLPRSRFATRRNR